MVVFWQLQTNPHPQYWLDVMDVKLSQPVRAHRPAGAKAWRPPGVSRPYLQPPRQSPIRGRTLGCIEMHIQCWALQLGLPSPPGSESPPSRAKAPWTPPAHLLLWVWGHLPGTGVFMSRPLQQSSFPETLKDPHTCVTCAHVCSLEMVGAGSRWERSEVRSPRPWSAPVSAFLCPNPSVVWASIPPNLPPFPAPAPPRHQPWLDPAQHPPSYSPTSRRFL